MKKVLKIIIKVLIILAAILVILLSAVLMQYKHRSKAGKTKQYQTTNNFISSDKSSISAHRSGAGIMPEETMMAFKNCINDKSFDVDFFEFDLHITADDQLVLLHDDLLDRTSDSEIVFGKPNVRTEEKTLAELKLLNMGYNFMAQDGTYPYRHAADLSDLRIATLDEVLDYLTSMGDYRYIIEVKNDGSLGMKALDILYKNLEQRGIVDKVIFGSFNKEVCAYADQKYPELIRCACSSEVVESFMTYVLPIKNKPVDYDILMLPFNDRKEDHFLNFGTSAYMNFAHKQNLAVFFWTINNESDMKYLNSIGADCILTDYPDTCYKLFND